MTVENTILLLYPTTTNVVMGQALKVAFQELGIPVKELVIEHNYAQVLDEVEKLVIPVVVS
ncbi:MAG: hypothetical protein GXP11_03660 [Gammaproteobacteria bacterium]|nr:hypothetical protein [Gammaproteobacteria bacterium]